MSCSNFPQQILTGGKEPYQGPNTLITTAPTSIAQAMGRVSNNGAVSVLVNKACTVTIYYFNIALGSWVVGSSTSGGYSRAFADSNGGLDFFQLPPKAIFCLSSDQASTVCYHDGDAVNS